ncbi:integral membrane protein [Coprinopsis cinerea okayama7|uniref:Integral membrane protein n=1 Tax=Coprinopsis cinerea (strain Okayama-7 / 130 / ATCC MYA-4618 / FGSC 9003) TaxID=240176 RepID=A8NU28_COPC7|nr:integral membrane protein [Coprinopsis cinerea okayama7\|eukprot:XP_001836365.1 integral membrane protein [Coprinopsis cinerea okayama7\
MTFLDLPPSLDWPAQFCAATMLATWVASLITGNVSQVDRLWTFLPTIYTAYYAFLPLFPNTQPFFLFPYAPKSFGWATATTWSPRALLMFGLTFTWMCRLTYNTYRRGLFNLNDEDYRWAVLRAHIPGALFQVFNLGFIVIIQNVLLLWLGLPARTAVQQPHDPLSTSDYAMAALALVLLALEFTSDNQQYAFHQYKHAYLAKEAGKLDVEYKPEDHWIGSRLDWTPEDAKRGFLSRGLWRYSRHPNFFCEQAFWWVITLFPLVSPSPPHLPSAEDLPPLRTIVISILHPDLRRPLVDTLTAVFYPAFMHLLPAISLSALFWGSTTFTESISKKKYPLSYGAYQKRVGMFAPGTTLLKLVQLKLFSSEEERKRLHDIVWGGVIEDKKTI